jgi:hypothetical protein
MNEQARPRQGTIVHDQFLDGYFSFSRYWVQPGGAVSTEPLSITFATKSEYRDFLRALRKHGVARGFEIKAKPSRRSGRAGSGNQIDAEGGNRVD